MSFLDRFRKKEDKKKLAGISQKSAAVSVSKKTEGISMRAAGKKGAKVKKITKTEPFGILGKPLITEKLSSQAAEGKYGFLVAGGANKIDIKKAVNATYGVDVKDVKIINVGGREVRYGRHIGRTKDWKKALVTLAPGEKIEVYEGV